MLSQTMQYHVVTRRVTPIKSRPLHVQIWHQSKMTGPSPYPPGQLQYGKLLVSGLDMERFHPILEKYQVVYTSIRSRPGEGPCLPRLVPGSNYQYQVQTWRGSHVILDQYQVVTTSIRSRPERVHVILDQYQVVTTSIRSRPDEGPCHTRLVPGSNYQYQVQTWMRVHVIQDQYQVVTTSIRSRPDEGPCHTRLVPGSNYQYQVQT